VDGRYGEEEGLRRATREKKEILLCGREIGESAEEEECGASPRKKIVDRTEKLKLKGDLRGRGRTDTRKKRRSQPAGKGNDVAGRERSLERGSLGRGSLARKRKRCETKGVFWRRKLAL